MGCGGSVLNRMMKLLKFNSILMSLMSYDIYTYFNVKSM